MSWIHYPIASPTSRLNKGKNEKSQKKEKGGMKWPLNVRVTVKRSTRKSFDCHKLEVL